MGKDELLTVNCPVCGKKLLRTKQGEIEIQCPKCKQMLEAAAMELLKLSEQFSE